MSNWKKYWSPLMMLNADTMEAILSTEDADARGEQNKTYISASLEDLKPKYDERIRQEGLRAKAIIEETMRLDEARIVRMGMEADDDLTRICLAEFAAVGSDLIETLILATALSDDGALLVNYAALYTFAILDMYDGTADGLAPLVRTASSWAFWRNRSEMLISFQSKLMTLYIKTGNYQRAVSIFGSLHRYEATNLLPLRLMAATLMHMGHTSHAVQVSKKALEVIGHVGAEAATARFFTEQVFVHNHSHHFGDLAALPAADMLSDILQHPIDAPPSMTLYQLCEQLQVDVHRLPDKSPFPLKNERDEAPLPTAGALGAFQAMEDGPLLATVELETVETEAAREIVARGKRMAPKLRRIGELAGPESAGSAWSQLFAFHLLSVIDNNSSNNNSADSNSSFSNPQEMSTSQALWWKQRALATDPTVLFDRAWRLRLEAIHDDNPFIDKSFDQLVAYFNLESIPTSGPGTHPSSKAKQKRMRQQAKKNKRKNRKRN